MTSNSSGATCAVVCWGVGLVAGLFLALGIFFRADWLFIQAAFPGLILFAVLGALLQRTMCGPLPAPVAPGSVRADPAPTVGAGAPEPRPAPDPAPAQAGTGGTGAEAAGGPGRAEEGLGRDVQAP